MTIFGESHDRLEPRRRHGEPTTAAVSHRLAVSCRGHVARTQEHDGHRSALDCQISLKTVIQIASPLRRRRRNQTHFGTDAI